MRIRAVLKASLLVIAAITVPVASARAQAITYTFTGTGTGVLGTAAFTNVFYSAVLQGQTPITQCIVPPANAFVNCPLTGSIFLTGVGTSSFTLPLYAFVNQSISEIGFGDFAQGDLISAIGVAGASTYTLDTNFGPVTGVPDAGSFTNVATSGGLLRLRTVGNVTFQSSTVVATPEPATFALVATGLLGVVGVARRRTGA